MTGRGLPLCAAVVRQVGVVISQVLWWHVPGARSLIIRATAAADRRAQGRRPEGFNPTVDRARLEAIRWKCGREKWAKRIPITDARFLLKQLDDATQRAGLS